MTTSIAGEIAELEAESDKIEVKSVFDPGFQKVWALSERIEDLRALTDLRSRVRLDADCAMGECGPGADFLPYIQPARLA